MDYLGERKDAIEVSSTGRIDAILDHLRLSFPPNKIPPGLVIQVQELWKTAEQLDRMAELFLKQLHDNYWEF